MSCVIRSDLVKRTISSESSEPKKNSSRQGNHLLGVRVFSQAGEPQLRATEEKAKADAEIQRLRDALVRSVTRRSKGSPHPKPLQEEANSSLKHVDAEIEEKRQALTEALEARKHLDEEMAETTQKMYSSISKMNELRER